MKKVFTAFVEYDEESKLYVGIVPNVPGAHTQAETLDELQHNLQEVLELCTAEQPRYPIMGIEISLSPDEFTKALEKI